MTKRKTSFGKVWDNMERECPGQTISRSEFIKECQRVTDPHRMQQDLTEITMEKGRKRMYALYTRNRIYKALKEN